MTSFEEKVIKIANDVDALQTEISKVSTKDLESFFHCVSHVA